MNRARPAAAALLVAAATLLTSCGGGEAGDAAARAAEVRAYAAAVAAITERSRTQLAAISQTAEYRRPEEAAASTRGYAVSIRRAATALDGAQAPAVVAARHDALVALYRSTADRMDALATEFSGARGAGALASRAQALSGEVQRLSTRETQLRRAIEQGLATATTPPS